MESNFAWNFCLVGALGLAATVGCHSKNKISNVSQDRQRTVIVAEEVLYQRPARVSQKLASLSFGQEVTVFDKKRVGIAPGWEEVHVGKNTSGFVRSSALRTREFTEKLLGLMKSLEGLEPQASGVTTTASAHLRLDPGREGQSIEKLPVETPFEMFERTAILVPQTATPPNQPQESKTRKEVWYKVRLSDGRVGYLYTRNLKFDPPPELSQYTQFRRAIAWLKLRKLEAKDSGGIDEYLVAYATPGIDFGADYDRVEIYIWDGKNYQTAFARSSLKGILPIPVIRDGNEVYFELREIDPKQPSQVFARRFHFPYPIKEVGSNTLEASVGIH